MHACCLYLVLSFFFPFIVLFFSATVSSEEVKKISYQYRYPLKGICFLLSADKCLQDGIEDCFVNQGLLKICIYQLVVEG